MLSGNKMKRWRNKKKKRDAKSLQITNQVYNVRLQRNDEALRVGGRETRSFVWRRNLGFITILFKQISDWQAAHTIAINHRY
jgi:hypothetical protein